jgi:hypothetical protein
MDFWETFISPTHESLMHQPNLRDLWRAEVEGDSRSRDFVNVPKGERGDFGIMSSPRHVKKMGDARNGKMGLGINCTVP